MQLCLILFGKHYTQSKGWRHQRYKTWLQYRFGMPKQTIDQNNTHSLNDFDIRDLYW
jgi:hypothetical protein